MVIVSSSSVISPIKKVPHPMSYSSGSLSDNECALNLPDVACASSTEKELVALGVFLCTFAKHHKTHDLPPSCASLLSGASSPPASASCLADLSLALYQIYTSHLVDAESKCAHVLRLRWESGVNDFFSRLSDEHAALSKTSSDAVKQVEESLVAEIEAASKRSSNRMREAAARADELDRAQELRALESMKVAREAHESVQDVASRIARSASELDRLRATFRAFERAFDAAAARAGSSGFADKVAFVLHTFIFYFAAAIAFLLVDASSTAKWLLACCASAELVIGWTWSDSPIRFLRLICILFALMERRPPPTTTTPPQRARRFFASSSTSSRTRLFSSTSKTLRPHTLSVTFLPNRMVSTPIQRRDSHSSSASSVSLIDDDRTSTD